MSPRKFSPVENRSIDTPFSHRFGGLECDHHTDVGVNSYFIPSVTLQYYGRWCRALFCVCVLLMQYMLLLVGFQLDGKSTSFTDAAPFKKGIK